MQLTIPFRPCVPVLASTITASLIGLVLLWHFKKQKKVYVKVGKVKKLFFYPVKSLSEMEVEELDCENRGVSIYGIVDRAYMLVKEDGTMVTRMDEPSLVFLKTSIVGNELVISGGSQEPLRLGVRDSVAFGTKKVTDCTVIEDSVKGVDCGDKAAQWFQKYLNRSDVRLVRCSSLLEKRIDGSSKKEGNKDALFQNKEPVHILSVASVEDVNKRLEKAVSELNFRPNILIEGCLPYAEDDWKFITFASGTELSSISPCGRCLQTTVDLETGVKTDKEPLSMLRKYRVLRDKKMAKEMHFSPCFGMLCRVDKAGSVRVGDDVFAVIKKGQYEFSVKV